jgi:hypothetical protein
MSAEEWECLECFHIYQTSKRDIGDCPFCSIYTKQDMGN